MLFGKAADAGVAVSTHNRELKGVGVEIPVPPRTGSEDLVWPSVLVSELSPNTAYVFAAIGIDTEGKL